MCEDENDTRISAGNQSEQSRLKVLLLSFLCCSLFSLHGPLSKEGKSPITTYEGGTKK